MSSISDFKLAINNYTFAFKLALNNYTFAQVLVLPIIIYSIIIISQLFITLVAHIYLLILLHFALEFARCAYRILQIYYVHANVKGVCSSIGITDPLKMSITDSFIVCLNSDKSQSSL